MLCDYINETNKYNTCLYSYTIFDILLTLITGYIISYLFKKPYMFWGVYFTMFLFLLGIILHKILFGKEKQSKTIREEEANIYNEITPSVKKINEQVTPALGAIGTFAGLTGHPEIAIPVEIAHASMELISYAPDTIKPV